jgi:hypothetical protein
MGSFCKTTPVGFEPTRGDPIGLAGRRLNRSAKVSLRYQCSAFAHPLAALTFKSRRVRLLGHCWILGHASCNSIRHRESQCWFGGFGQHAHLDATMVNVYVGKVSIKPSMQRVEEFCVGRSSQADDLTRNTAMDDSIGGS